MFEIKTNSLFCIQFIGLLCHCKGSLTESRRMRLQTALEPSVLQCQFFRAFIIWKLHESKQSIWNRTKSKKIERKKGRQEQTSKLQIKACEMQPRIADPYWARGWGGRGGSGGGVPPFLRTQSRGVSLWWRSVTWAHLGWGCSSSSATADTLCQKTELHIWAVLIHFGTRWQKICVNIVTFINCPALTDPLELFHLFWKARLENWRLLSFRFPALSKSATDSNAECSPLLLIL